MKTNNAAHTPWRYEELHDGRDSLGLRVYHGDNIACSIFGCGVEDFDNARLFTEAGTVVTETGLTPRQLAEQRTKLLGERTAMAEEIAALSEQRAELLEALKECKRLNNMDRPINCTEVVNEAIAKCGGALITKISIEPVVPVSKLKELVEEWRKDSGVTFSDPVADSFADQLESLFKTGTTTP